MLGQTILEDDISFDTSRISVLWRRWHHVLHLRRCSVTPFILRLDRDCHGCMQLMPPHGTEWRSNDGKV